MRNVWTFTSAGSIVFGNGSLQRLPGIVERFKVTRVAVVTDKGIIQAGLLQPLLTVLEQADIQPAVYQQETTEPSVASVSACFTELKKSSPELFIALGGGSSIDLAKMTSLLLSHGGPLSDYYGENRVPGAIRPVIAIPTTAGTGADVSPVAVVTDDETKLKIGISDQNLRPAVSLLDPELTLKLPPYLTACTGMDALSQAIEAYFAKDHRYIEAGDNVIYQGGNPLSDQLAEKAIELIGRNLQLAVHQGSHLEARANMMLGNLFSALAFTNSGTSLIHALAYPIYENSERPHGEIIALLLPYVMQYNASVCTEKFARIAELLRVTTGGETAGQKAEQAISAVFQLVADLGLPTKLSEIGIEHDHIPGIVAKALPLERLVRLNPRTAVAKEVEEVLYQAL
ncbi:iron-containing alcohol dehydrogenase [Alkalihalobacillus oceani]|uniref:hydroxyacid-oxoacid transhydrogenase n=1 Tax=Halalkalibacter oceani TaxID=1653776 RepID=A0A9X2IPG1_9BACI|nr:iron-containing alcohol dehydrogenase [Halalkalibacter oceani]